MMNEKQAKEILEKEKCCGKKMRITGVYLNGTDTTTATCLICGGYVSIEIGQFDEEEVDEIAEDAALERQQEKEDREKKVK